MQEELDELTAASTLVDQADALIDLIYFALGTLVEMGLDAEALFEIVHDANIAKLQTKQATVVRDDGKVGKPDGWTSPELRMAERMISSISPYTLIRASDTSDSLQTCIDMIAEAIGSVDARPSPEPFARSGPITATDMAYSEYISGPLTDYLRERGIPLVDSYLPPEVLDEATFAADLTQALATSPAVLVAFDARAAYRRDSSSTHWALVANVLEDRIALVDPSPSELGINHVNCDSLLAGMRSIWQGVHRLRPLGNER